MEICCVPKSHTKPFYIGNKEAPSGQGMYKKIWYYLNVLEQRLFSSQISLTRSVIVNPNCSFSMRFNAYAYIVFSYMSTLYFICLHRILYAKYKNTNFTILFLLSKHSYMRIIPRAVRQRLPVKQMIIT